MRMGFTLVEVMAALIVMALLAGAVSVSLRSVLKRAAVDNAVSQFARFDHDSRELARRSGQALEMRLHLESGRLERIDLATGDTVGSPLFLLEGVAIDRVMQSETEVDSYGTVKIRCSERGFTPSYAVRMARPGSAQQWLVLAGLSGDARTERNDWNVQQIFAQITLPRVLANRHDVD